MQVVANEWRGTPSGPVEYYYDPIVRDNTVGDAGEVRFRVPDTEYWGSMAVWDDEVNAPYFGAMVKSAANDFYTEALRTGVLGCRRVIHIVSAGSNTPEFHLTTRIDPDLLAEEIAFAGDRNATMDLLLRVDELMMDADFTRQLIEKLRASLALDEEGEDEDLSADLLDIYKSKMSDSFAQDLDDLFEKLGRNNV